jgi:hypothetical protein
MRMPRVVEIVGSNQMLTQWQLAPPWARQTRIGRFCGSIKREMAIETQEVHFGLSLLKAHRPGPPTWDPDGNSGIRLRVHSGMSCRDDRSLPALSVFLPST